MKTTGPRVVGACFNGSVMPIDTGAASSLVTAPCAAACGFPAPEDEDEAAGDEAETDAAGAELEDVELELEHPAASSKAPAPAASSAFLIGTVLRPFGGMGQASRTAGPP
jgi:hypothetical protein